MTSTISGLTEGTVTVGADLIHYVEKGVGTPIVMVHGYAPISSWRVWESNIDALAAANRVIAVDLSGYGDSTGESPTEFEVWFRTYAQVLHTVICELGIAPTALCGLSAGGGACLTLTLQHPEDVSRLVLVDAAGAQAADLWRGIQVPTLLTWQREDQIVPLEQGEQLRDAIPNSHLEVFEGNPAGIEPYDWHWSQALNPERFNRAVGDFLAAPRN